MKSFRIEIRSGFAEWDRYAVFMTAVCFDAGGAMVDYVNQTDKSLALETPPCDHAELYLYVIAREFPASELVTKSPPFDIEISISKGGETPLVKTFPVNQWGGLSARQSLA
jgi:hypothetical protein